MKIVEVKNVVYMFFCYLKYKKFADEIMIIIYLLTLSIIKIYFIYNNYFKYLLINS